MDELKSKVETISLKYADLVEKRLNTALKKDEIGQSAMWEINDEIRMLGHITATLEKINRLNRGNDTNGSFYPETR